MEKKIKNKKNFLHRKGFSFIESILAVFLVSVGVIAGLKLLTVGLKDSMESRDQFAASLLAQEGVELVRNIRDNNWVDNDPSTGSFNYFPADDNNRCIADKDTSGVNISCGVNNGQMRLRLDNDNYYMNSGSTNTKFFRRIKFNYCNVGCSGIARDAAKSVVVTSLVSWNGEVSGTSVDDCNTSTKCAYTQIILNKWGE
ncbi:MAG TPA: hypothetical protein P5262_03360 [Candidatus Moranbacteria bacterium]|nr:hypothetical protein [Candidatus Moranbacteria bacterium]